MTVLGHSCAKEKATSRTKNSLKQRLTIITMFDPKSFIILEQKLTIQCISLTKGTKQNT